MAQYPYDQLGTPLDTANLEKANGNWAKIEADIKSVDSASQQRDTGMTADYTAKLLAQKNEYTYRLDSQYSDYTQKFNEQKSEYSDGFLVQKNRIDGIVSEITNEAIEGVIDSAKLKWVNSPVDSFSGIATIYPNPTLADTVYVRDTGKVFRYDGMTWREIQQIDAGPFNDLEGKIEPFVTRSIFASKFMFTNTGTDGAKLKTLIETVNADVLYIDTDIYIDKGIRFDLSKVKKIVGFGGKITISNKTDSLVPYLKWENCHGLEFENVKFQGDFNKALTSDAQYQGTIVSPMFLSLSNNVKVINCTFTGIVGAGAVMARYCDNLRVENNDIIDCWNRISGDLQGDGVYIAFSAGAKVRNNHIQNNFPDKTKFGRIGVTFEFEQTKDCICEGNYIYGYDRAVHAELIGGPLLVKGNIAEGCPMSFIGWQNYNQPITVDGNIFSNKGVPTDYVAQLGQGTRGFLSFFTNTILEEVNRNTVISNNQFILEVDVPSIQEFVFTKISGEEYTNNIFLDKTRNKRLFMFNPSETTTINNNNLKFNNNKVSAKQVYFGHIGKHEILRNDFDVATFVYICTPAPTLSATERRFFNNYVHNGENGIVQTAAYVFVNKVSLWLMDNVFKDIGIVSGQQNTLIRANQDYTSTPFLKNIMDNNTLISTLPDTISLIFFGRMDNMMHSTTTNKKILSTGVTYEMSGMSNNTNIVTKPNGNEGTITVNDAGVLSFVGQRFK